MKERFPRKFRVMTTRVENNDHNSYPTNVVEFIHLFLPYVLYAMTYKNFSPESLTDIHTPGYESVYTYGHTINTTLVTKCNYRP